MTKANVKEKLMKATTELLLEEGHAETITSRQIAEKAETNLAMINYYFHSKDELINSAVNLLIQSAADSWMNVADSTQSPYEKLLNMLLQLSKLTMQYYSFTKTTTIYELTKTEIHLPYYIIPLLEQIYGDQKSDFEVKMIAFEIISFLQVLMIKAEDFFKYAGKDVRDDTQREFVIRTFLKSTLGHCA